MFNPIHKVRIVIFNWLDRRLPMPHRDTIHLYDGFIYLLYTVYPEYKKPRTLFTISEYLEFKRVFLSMLQAWYNVDEMYRRRWAVSRELDTMLSPFEFAEACFEVSMKRLKVLLEKWNPEDAHA